MTSSSITAVPWQAREVLSRPTSGSGFLSSTFEHLFRLGKGSFIVCTARVIFNVVFSLWNVINFFFFPQTLFRSWGAALAPQLPILFLQRWLYTGPLLPVSVQCICINDLLSLHPQIGHVTNARSCKAEQLLWEKLSEASLQAPGYKGSTRRGKVKASGDPEKDNKAETQLATVYRQCFSSLLGAGMPHSE